MNKFIAYTFRGISREYYVRALLFSSWLPILFVVLAFMSDSQGTGPGASAGSLAAWIAYWVASWLLFPYAKLVYETVIEYLFQNTLLISNLVVLLFWRAMVTGICLVCAVFIAPVGLLILYLHHRKQERLMHQEQSGRGFEA